MDSALLGDFGEYVAQGVAFGIDRTKGALDLAVHQGLDLHRGGGGDLVEQAAPHQQQRALQQVAERVGR